MANRHYGTHLSPLDFDELNRIDYGAGRVLAENYAKRISRHHKVDYYKLEQVLSTVYGRDWYKQRYAKLHKLASVLPKMTGVNEGYYTPEGISRKATHRYATEYYRLEDSYAYRKAVRVFGRARIKECYTEMDKRNTEDLAKAVLGYRMVRVVDGRGVADAMKKRIPTLANVRSVYNSYTRTYWDNDVLCVLPDHIRSDVEKLATEVAVRSATRDYTMPNYVTMAGRILNNIKDRASNIRTAPRCNEYYIECTTDKLSKAISNMYVMLELEKNLNSMGLEIDRNKCYYELEPRGYKNTKIEPKLVRAVKTIMATKYDDEAKRQMVFDIEKKLVNERDTRRRINWLPQIARKGEKGAN